MVTTFLLFDYMFNHSQKDVFDAEFWMSLNEMQNWILFHFQMQRMHGF